MRVRSRAARRRARSTHRGRRSTYSWSAWAPPPVDAEAVERRDAEGGGEVAVAAAADGDARPARAARASTATLRARANSSAVADSGIGGRLSPPSTSSRAAGSTGAQRRHRRLEPLAPRPSSVTRTSTRTRASAGTTLSAVPARATVGVTVVPALGSAERGDRQHLVRRLDERVDALLRLQPGVRGPAVDDDLERRRCPCGRSSARRRRPPARARAPRRTPRARSSISARDVAEPTSSSAVNSSSTPDRSASAATAWTPSTMPPFMSNTPGPVARPSATRERPGGQRAEREHGVVVADEQHPRLAAAAPVHVRPGRAVDELGRRCRAGARSARRRPPPTPRRRRRRATATRPRPGSAGRRAGRRGRTSSRHGTGDRGSHLSRSVRTATPATMSSTPTTWRR